MKISSRPITKSKAFERFAPARVEQALADFSGLRTGAAPFTQLQPRSAAEACAIIEEAHEKTIALRTRAQGHSLNGATLPAKEEVVLSTRELRDVRFAARGTVTAGAGTVLWVLQAELRRRGFDLPVLNDGYAGPTLGGYLAAGGFGPQSWLHGGFWDNVLSVRFVDGRGRLREAGSGDALFPWLFGSMGQLGVIVEATLAIVPAARAAAYPLGGAFQAPRLAEQHVPLEFAPPEAQRLFWFTLFVPDQALAEAQQSLRALEKTHAAALRFAERYTYPIRYRGRTAPLVYPFARAFTATGAWGWLAARAAAGVQRLLDFERDFMALARSRADYRRYIQSELAAGPATYEQCFGAQVYAELRALKDELDPRRILNRGSVFEP